MNFKRIASVGFVFFICALLAGGALAQTLQAPAERVDFKQRGTLYKPMMDFIYELGSRSDLLQVQKISETLMGRDVVLTIMSDPPVYAPGEAVRSGKPMVLIVNNVHGGEYSGKDATLILMRDLLLGDLKPLLRQVTVLIIPTINPDGAEVYRRTNEQRFDLNRDYLKLESQEIQSLVTSVINMWQPDIHVDTHHGGSAPYTLTYQTCLNPSCDQDIVAMGNNEIIPRIQKALRGEDYDGFWYSGPRSVDGREGWSPTSCEPRKQHTYSGLANMVGFLFETPRGSHRVINNGSEVVEIPQEERYRHQVRGEYLGQREVIRFAAENGDKLRDTVNRAKAKATRLGLNDADNDQIILEYKQDSKGDETFWRVKGWSEQRGRGPASGQIEYEKVTLPVFTKFTPTRTTTRPWGYMLPPNMATVLPLLLDHQISVKRLTEPVELEVETYYASQVRETQYFQGHYLKAVDVDKKVETVTFPVGSLLVPTGQPKANLISYMMEPETNDNLITWNYLDNYLQVMSPEQLQRMQQMRARAGAGRQQSSGQRIPIYRIMKKAEIKGALAQPFNKYQRNRYIR
jgi:hypothetical protein